MQEAQAQKHRHHQIVRDHRAERHRGDDDHGGRRGQTAQIGNQRQPPLPRRDRQEEHVEIALTDPGEHPGEADRQHEQVDRQQVAGQQPARRAQVRLGDVLDHRNLELAIEKQEGEAGHGGDQEPVGIAGSTADDGQWRAIGQGGSLAEHVAEPVEHDVGDVDADDQERDELHHALERHGQHHALMMLGGVDVPGTEDDAEQGQQEQDEEGGVSAAGTRDRSVGGTDQRGNAGGDGL